MNAVEYFVEVVNYDGEVVKRVGPVRSEREADKVERGMNINLNHEKFYTRIGAETADQETTP